MNTFLFLFCGCKMSDLFRCCHEINGRVVLIIILKQTEGELVVYQKMIYKKNTNCTTIKNKITCQTI